MTILNFVAQRKLNSGRVGGGQVLTRQTLTTQLRIKNFKELSANGQHSEFKMTRGRSAEYLSPTSRCDLTRTSARPRYSTHQPCIEIQKNLKGFHFELQARGSRIANGTATELNVALGQIKSWLRGGPDRTEVLKL